MVELANIDYAVVDGCAEITIDRPDVLNAFDEQTYGELEEAIEVALDDTSVYAIILTGRGRAFSAGRDLTQPSPDTKAAFKVYNSKARRGHERLYEGTKPTIAAVNGPALGAGCGYALCCDFRVMSHDAFLRDQHVNIGLTPGVVGKLLSQLIGESQAKAYMLLGRDITARDAEELGLALRVVDPEEVVDAARELAQEVINKPVVGVRNTKELMTDSPFGSVPNESERFWECIMDPEHEEAVAALQEDRDPRFDR